MLSLTPTITKFIKRSCNFFATFLKIYLHRKPIFRTLCYYRANPWIRNDFQIASNNITCSRINIFRVLASSFSNSAVKVHHLQAYRDMEMTRSAISFTFDPRDMLLSLQMGFSFDRAAVACAILERTSGLEPSSETTVPRYLKLVAVPNFCLFTFISLSGCHWRCLSSVWCSLHRSHLIPCAGFVETFYQGF